MRTQWSRRLFGCVLKNFVCAAIATTLGLPTVGFAGEPVPAVARANKSANVAAGHDSLELVYYDVFVQKEAATTTKPPAAPPSQPDPKPSTVKPAPSAKVLAPPVATGKPARPVASGRPESRLSTGIADGDRLHMW